MTAAEQSIRDRGFVAAEMVVERFNRLAQEFYERMGYSMTRTLVQTYSYTTPEGDFREHELDLIELRKELI
jgi:ribosomal protein S18 acetylase RimI-like enzyme